MSLPLSEQLDGYRRQANSGLKALVLNADDTSREKLHASLALLPVDSTQLPFLEKRLLVATPAELRVIRDALQRYRVTLTPNLWSVLDSLEPGDESLLQAASALAIYDPDNVKWDSVDDAVAEALVSVNSVYLGPWLDALRPVRTKLTAPLATIFREKNRPATEHSLATNILTSYASDDPDLIADLLMDSDPKAYAAFLPIAQRQEAETLRFLQAEINKKVTTSDSDKDAEMVKDRLAERQARAAITLLRMGKADGIIPLLRHSADPRLRSFIVNWLNPLGADPHVIAAALEQIDPGVRPTPDKPPKTMDDILFHLETSQRRALILALGTYGLEGLSRGDREPLIGKLLALYENDPDAGIHGAAEWTLRKWGQQESLEAKAAAMRGKEPGEHRWFVNGQGQTFALIDGPVEFQMGSPPNEPHRSLDDMALHRRTIPRRFFIAAKEVTVEQFLQFLRADPEHAQYNAHEHPGAAQYLVDQYSSPRQGGPMICVSWYAAVAYCNWLSRKEKLRRVMSPTATAIMPRG